MRYDLDAQLYPAASPESQGVPSGAILSFLTEMRRRNVDMHSFFMFRNGRQIAGGCAKPFEPDTPHRIHSAAKSVTALAVLFAIQEGLLSLTDRVTDLFRDELPEEIGENLSRMTLYHLLTMTAGHRQDSFMALRKSDDWVRTFFAEPFVYRPGTRFLYDNGIPHILGVLVEKVSGLDYVEYLRPRLLEPVGIYLTVEKTPQGQLEGSSTVCSSGGVAKLTLFYLQRGRWGGRQLLDPELVRLATSNQVPSAPGFDVQDAEAGFGYGFQVWQNSFGGFSLNGGMCQRGIGVPELNLAISWTAWEMAGRMVSDAAREMLYKHLYARPIDENDADRAALEQWLDGWSCAPSGDAASPLADSVSGNRYVMEPNRWRIKALTMDYNSRLLLFETETGSAAMRFGVGGDFEANDSYIDVPPKDRPHHLVYRVEPDVMLAGGNWTAPDTFEFIIRHTGWSTYDVFRCRYEGDTLYFRMENIDDKQLRDRAGAKEKYVRPTFPEGDAANSFTGVRG